jgi:hypothetical protein
VGPGTEGSALPPVAAVLLLLPLLLQAAQEVMGSCGAMPRTALTCSRDLWRASWSTCEQQVHTQHGQVHWCWLRRTHVPGLLDMNASRQLHSGLAPDPLALQDNLQGHNQLQTLC